MYLNEVFSRSNKFVRGLIFSCAFVWLFQVSVQASQSLTLGWDIQSDPSVAGYKIYYGTTSHSYDQVLVVSNTSSATISGLTAGATYYFAATAFDASGNESDFSNEAAFTVAAASAPVGSLLNVASNLPGKQFGFTVSVEAGRTCVVQASTNLVDWVPVQTNSVSFTFVDSDTTSYTRRFFRVCTY